MDPCAGLSRGADQWREGIGSAGVHVACLQAEDRPIVQQREGVGTHPSLAIDWHPFNRGAARARADRAL